MLTLNTLTIALPYMVIVSPPVCDVDAGLISTIAGERNGRIVIAALLDIEAWMDCRVTGAAMYLNMLLLAVVDGGALCAASPNVIITIVLYDSWEAVGATKYSTVPSVGVLALAACSSLRLLVLLLLLVEAEADTGRSNDSAWNDLELAGFAIVIGVYDQFTLTLLAVTLWTAKKPVPYIVTSVLAEAKPTLGLILLIFRYTCGLAVSGVYVVIGIVVGARVVGMGTIVNCSVTGADDAK
jgi:hypothetical protein